MLWIFVDNMVSIGIPNEDIKKITCNVFDEVFPFWNKHLGDRFLIFIFSERVDVFTKHMVVLLPLMLIDRIALTLVVFS